MIERDFPQLRGLGFGVHHFRRHRGLQHVQVSWQKPREALVISLRLHAISD